MNTLLALIVYLGCRASTNGLHVLDVDADTGALRRVSSLPFPAANFLATTPDGRYLLASTKDGLASFAADGASLTEVERVTTAGSPCHVSSDGEKAYWAAYSAGNCGSFDFKDGHFSNPTVYTHKPRIDADGKERKTYCHMMIPAPDGRRACVVDLGLDTLFTYPDGTATRTQPTGAGPRHMGFFKDSQTACVLFEVGNKLGTYRWDAATGTFAALDEHTTLSAGFIGKSYGGALRITPDGTQAVAANRGDDSLASFDCDLATGKLKLKAVTPMPGKWVQDFVFVTDDLALVALESSGTVASLRYNRTKGTFDPLRLLKGLKSPCALASRPNQPLTPNGDCPPPDSYPKTGTVPTRQT